MNNDRILSLEQLKQDIICKISERQEEGILEKENADFLIKLIEKAENKTDVLKISALGMTYKRTGFHFDVRLEKNEGKTIKYLKKNEELSFYQGGIIHKLIIGDNYPALLNLLISYRKQIKVIYIDPLYGKDNLGDFAKTNYNNAITRDNLLSMLYPRLMLAKQLLKDDGVIFCSIDDKNQAYIKGLFDEIFGESNFCGNITWLKGNAQNDSQTIQRNHEYILCYTKDISCKPINKTSSKERVKAILDKKLNRYYYEGAGITTGGDGGTLNTRINLGYSIYYNEKTNDFIAINDYDKKLAETSNDETQIYKDDNKLIQDGYIPIRPPKKDNKLGRWTWAIDTFNSNKESIIISKSKDKYKVCKKEWLNSEQIKEDEKGLYAIIEKESPPKSFIDFASSSSGSKELKDIFENSSFNNPKNIKLIKYLLDLSSSKNELVSQDIILDFFAGSGTTGHAVLELNKEDGGNRQFILVTNNEKTDINPNGIVYDVTSKRLKRVMSGECYDKTNNFKWLEKNTTYGDSLEVTEIENIPSNNREVFNLIDEKLYNEDFKEQVQEKIEWVCREFEITCRTIEGE